MKPIVSIIIATYNSQKTIRKALDSVIGQKYQEWECIIVDGLSSDNTIKIVKKYVEQDKRIRFISEKDNGIYNAFNKGWKMANGDWVYYLGSDDKLSYDSFTMLSQYLNTCSKNIAVISGDVIRHSRLGKIRVEKSRGFFGSHQAKLTKKSIIEKIGGFDEKYKILADYDMYIRIEGLGYQAVNINTIIAEFYSGGASESIKNLRKIFMERYVLMKKDPHFLHPLISSMTMTLKDFVSIFLSKVCICKK